MLPTTALETLRQHRAELARYGVRSMGVFGSVARGTAGEASDIDILVEFAGPTRFDDFMGLKLFLEDLLGLKVDLVTPKALKPGLRARIEKDLLRVA